MEKEVPAGHESSKTPLSVGKVWDVVDDNSRCEWRITFHRETSPKHVPPWSSPSLSIGTASRLW